MATQHAHTLTVTIATKLYKGTPVMRTFPSMECILLELISYDGQVPNLFRLFTGMHYNIRYA